MRHHFPLALAALAALLVTALVSPAVTDEKAEVTVRNIETKEETVCPKSDIKALPPAVSTMPPMGMILSKADIRDLVAFLSSMK